jgi:hypothetical protein
MRLNLLALLVALPVVIAGAQENYEIQVYGAKTADRGTTFFELHSNYTGSGSRMLDGTVLPTNNAIHETLEITHGFSDIFEVGFYIFTTANQGTGWQFVGSHIRPRIRAPDSWKLPVGLSLSTEFGPVSTKCDANNWGIELRPIIDQTVGDVYWAFNPTVGWALKGPDAGTGAKGMIFNPNIKVQWNVTKLVGIGAEYYGVTGSINRMAPASEQSHIVYPSIDLDFSDDWEFNIGYGVRVAGTGDHDIIKMIIGRRFPF